MRPSNRSRIRSSMVIIWLLGLLCIGVVGVAAQGEPPAILNPGENRVADITETNPAPRFGVVIAEPQTVEIQVVAITQGMSPAFTVFAPSGVILQQVDNLAASPLVSAEPLMSAPGLYQIEVRSANNAFGQFIIIVQPGDPLEPPQPLSLGQVVNDEVDPDAPRHGYTFPASTTETLVLTVNSVDPTNAPVIQITDADTNEVLAVSSGRMAGARYRVPAVPPGSPPVNYVVDVLHGGGDDTIDYAICLELESAVSVCPAGQAVVAAPTAIPTFTPVPAISPTPPPTLLPTGPCVVASATGGAINIRSGPSTSYSVVSQLVGNNTAAVIGRLPDNSWVQVNLSGLTGWISLSVTRIGGQCNLVPAVTLTPTTGAPSATLPPSATFTLTATTASATPTFTHTPTNTLEAPTAVPTLNFSLPPNYGSTALTSGFVPDPFTVGISSGGAVNVSYLGGGCTGYATSAPDFSVNYTSGGATLLRFYFIGGGDTTMVINSPSGSYSCVDDSFSTLNPTIDFNAPSSGRYDVWIGSFAEGTSTTGTLYVSEIASNHP